MNEIEQNELYLLQSSSTELLLELIDCGHFAALRCLCSPYVREAHQRLLAYPIELREVFLRKLCQTGCSPTATNNNPSTSAPLHEVGTSLDIAEVCSYVGKTKPLLDGLFDRIRLSTRPTLTLADMRKTQWCGILVAYILSANGYPVFWSVGRGIRYTNTDRPLKRIAAGSVMTGDVIVQPTSPWHHIIVTGLSSTGSIALTEGNTPNLKCYAIDQEEFSRYSDWIHYRPERS